MQPDNDDAVWRAIVENYGDRVELDPEPAADITVDPVDRSRFEVRPEDVHDDEELARLEQVAREEREWSEARREAEERYVPPPPPPVPRTTPDRLAAWVGVLLSPVALILLLVLHMLSGFVELVLVAAFVGGFVYLVARMPRGPGDPYDDGARL